MTYRVKIWGPGITGPFGSEAYTIASPTDVRDVDGVLMITTPPLPVRPHPRFENRTLPAIRSRQIIYPRGAWNRIIVEDIVDEEADHAREW